MSSRAAILKKYIDNLEDRIQELTMDPKEPDDILLEHLCNLQDTYWKEFHTLKSKQHGRPTPKFSKTMHSSESPIPKYAIDWLLAPTQPKKTKKSSCSGGICKPKIQKKARKVKINDCACTKCDCPTKCKGCPCC